MKINSHKDLKLWKESIDLVEDIYRIPKSLPKEEIYGLTRQIRRASVSIPSNIAEGASRQGGKEFSRFLYIALGSLAELETQLEITIRLNYIKSVEVELIFERIIYIRRMIAKLIKTLNT